MIVFRSIITVTIMAITIEKRMIIDVMIIKEEGGCFEGGEEGRERGGETTTTHWNRTRSSGNNDKEEGAE